MALKPHKTHYMLDIDKCVDRNTFKVRHIYSFILLWTSFSLATFPDWCFYILICVLINKINNAMPILGAHFCY